MPPPGFGGPSPSTRYPSAPAIIWASPYSARQVTEAATCFNAVLKQAPEFALAHTNLGNGAEGPRSTGKRQSPVTEGPCSSSPTASRALQNLGFALHGGGQNEEASQVLSSCADASIRSPRKPILAWPIYGTTRESRRPPKGLAPRPGIETPGKRYVEQFGQCPRRACDSWNDAMDCYRRSLILAPDNARAYYNQANAST